MPEPSRLRSWRGPAASSAARALAVSSDRTAAMVIVLNKPFIGAPFVRHWRLNGKEDQLLRVSGVFCLLGGI
jgi:hypothetical protein